MLTAKVKFLWLWDKKPGQGHRDILVQYGLEVFLHLALSEKLSKSSHL